VDQGREADGQDEAAQLPSVPIERGTPLAERNRLQPGNLWRRLALPRRFGNWSLTSLQQRLVKTGGRLVRHARYYCLLLAEGHLSRRLFSSMLRRIGALPLPDG